MIKVDIIGNTDYLSKNLILTKTTRNVMLNLCSIITQLNFYIGNSHN